MTFHKPGTGTTAPGAPTLTMAAANATTIAVSSNSPTGATAYTFQIATDSGFTTGVQSVTRNMPNWSFTVAPATQYFGREKVANSNSQSSAWSIVKTATTPAAPAHMEFFDGFAGKRINGVTNPITGFKRSLVFNQPIFFANGLTNEQMITADPEPAKITAWYAGLSDADAAKDPLNDIEAWYGPPYYNPNYIDVARRAGIVTTAARAGRVGKTPSKMGQYQGLPLRLWNELQNGPPAGWMTKNDTMNAAVDVDYIVCNLYCVYQSGKNISLSAASIETQWVKQAQVQLTEGLRLAAARGGNCKVRALLCPHYTAEQSTVTDFIEPGFTDTQLGTVKAAGAHVLVGWDGINSPIDSTATWYGKWTAFAAANS